MDSNIELFPFPIIFILIIYALLVTLIDDTAILIILTTILVIIGFITALIYLFIHRASRRDREQPIIENIIDNFLIPARSQVRIDGMPIDIWTFIETLGISFGVSTNSDMFNRFSKRKRLFAWRISRYNKLCRKINSRINSLTANARIRNIIEEVTDGSGVHMVLVDEYEDYSKEQIEELLERNNLMFMIRNIDGLHDKLSDKARKLDAKLDRLISKWREKYNII